MTNSKQTPSRGTPRNMPLPLEHRPSLIVRHGSVNDIREYNAALAGMATDALKGSVKLSNEVIGVMGLIERGIRPTRGIVKAMRKYIADVTAFVDEIE
jgi:hypothetical protein